MNNPSNNTLTILKPTELNDIQQVIDCLNNNNVVVVNVKEDTFGKRFSRQFLLAVEKVANERNLVLEYVAHDIVLIDPLHSHTVKEESR